MNQSTPTSSTIFSKIIENDVNVSSELISWIESRRSISNLELPAPDDEQIKQAIHCAMTAPDHKILRPWRFIVTSGEARDDLAGALLTARLQKAEQAGEQLEESARLKTLNLTHRAPTIITVVTQMQYHDKVPEFEQMLSAGACVQNLILALQAQGFSTIWRTGLLCNEPAVKQYFNIADKDFVTGFIYVGTAKKLLSARKDIVIDDYVRFES